MYHFCQCKNDIIPNIKNKTPNIIANATEANTIEQKKAIGIQIGAVMILIKVHIMPSPYKVQFFRNQHRDHCGV